ncbi:hypothetical protein ACFFYR_29285 [Paraburkholderia dipogonis]|uniref:hypothetical protein n=1 Tax=Paraburkholderia dipogonis TaxID=1211383 RepID=UPI0035EC1C61
MRAPIDCPWRSPAACSRWSCGGHRTVSAPPTTSNTGSGSGSGSTKTGSGSGNTAKTGTTGVATAAGRPPAT